MAKYAVELTNGKIVTVNGATSHAKAQRAVENRIAAKGLSLAVVGSRLITGVQR